MSGIVELPERTLLQVEELAKRRGVTAAELIRQLVEPHVEHRQFVTGREVRLPLIPASETGTIGPFNGFEVDELLAE